MNKIRNRIYTAKSMAEKIGQLRWFGHVKTMANDKIVRHVLED